MSSQTISVCMIAYNHESYIAQAIEGVLMQETDFEIQLVIGEDCSSDNTREIVKKYKDKYSNKITLLLQDRNQGVSKNFLDTLKLCKGKYIALCEGDDYWTDPFKLQKQKNFLDKNNDYNLVCTGYNLKKDKQIYPKIINNKNDLVNANGFDFTLTDLIHQWIPKTLTVVFRSRDQNEFYKHDFKYFRDTHLVYILLRNSKGYYLNDITGVANIHSEGVHSTQSRKNKVIDSFYCYLELYKFYKDEYIRKRLLDKIKQLIIINGLYLSSSKDSNNINLVSTGFKLTKNYLEVLTLLLYFKKRLLKLIKSRIYN